MSGWHISSGYGNVVSDNSISNRPSNQPTKQPTNYLCLPQCCDSSLYSSWSGKYDNVHVQTDKISFAIQFVRASNRVYQHCTLQIKTHKRLTERNLIVTRHIVKGVRFKRCRLCKKQTACHALLYIHSTSDLGIETCSHPLVRSVNVN